MSGEQTTKKIRFGIVGAGAIAQTYGQAFPKCEAAELVAIADVRTEAAAAMATAHGCRGFSSYQAMQESLTLDAVVVSTPPATHPEIATYFLARQVHVLCEKPLAVDSESARSMIACAKRSRTLLTMASKFRFVQDLIQAKSIIASGILGDIVLFENTFAAPVDMTQRWNAQRRVSGGGVLIDNGTHSVDIMRYLFGPVAEIYAQQAKQIQPIEVEDTVELTVRTANHVMGKISLSWSLRKEEPCYVTIYAKQGTMLVGWAESKYRRNLADDWIVFGSGYDKVRAFRDQIDNFARAIQGRDELLITDVDAMASVEVIEAAYCSLETDASVPVENMVLDSREVETMETRVHATAIVEEGVRLGRGTAIWDHVHVRYGTQLGEQCIVGGKSFIAYQVEIGNRVKINSFVYVCHGVTIEDGVMISAGTIFTNDRCPRATTSELTELRPSEPDDHTLRTRVREGATIGARSVIGPGIEIGRFSMVGMGSVVTRSVADFHLVVGNPARAIGCVCRCGRTLHHFDHGAVSDEIVCPGCGLRYCIDDRRVSEVRSPS